MGAERAHEQELDGVTWLRAWTSARATVRLGECVDGRWVAWHSKRGPTWFYDERGACDRLDRVMARGGWRELFEAEAA
jgi:hypothetical protein